MRIRIFLTNYWVCGVNSMFNKRENILIGDKDNNMNSREIFNLKEPVRRLMICIVIAATLLTSSMVFAAVHNVTLTAKALPNGQLGYALGDNEAAIPGPTLFVREGDTISVTLNNNTKTSVGFKIPGLQQSSAKVKPGQSKNYSIQAKKSWYLRIPWQYGW